MRKNIWLIGGIIIFFIVLSIDLFTDLRIGDKVNHQRGAIVRVLGLIPCLVCLIVYRPVKWWIAPSLMCFNYWNLFDGFYNIFRGFGWFFTGSEDGAGDAASDNFLQSIPLWAHICIKILGSLITIFLYFKNKTDDNK